MASYRKVHDKDGKHIGWEATIYLGRDADGKAIRKYLRMERERDLKRAAKQIELDHKEAVTSSVGKKRVVAWFEEYVELNRNDFSPATQTLYAGYLKNHYKPFFKQLRMDKVTDHHLKQFQNWLLETLAPSTANRIMSALKGAFTDGLKVKSPFVEFSLVEPNDPDVSAPSVAEFAEIQMAVAGSGYEIPVLLAAWCGFRRAEILALRVDDLDFEKETIRIDEAWSKHKDGKYVLKKPKSKRGAREERVPPGLMERIRKMLTDGKVVELNPSGDRFLFNSRPDTFSTSYRNFLRRRGAPAYTFHELRHYHATWLWDSEIPDKYAAKRMGQTVEVLKSTYQHLGLKKQDEVDEKVIAIAKATHN